MARPSSVSGIREGRDGSSGWQLRIGPVGLDQVRSRTPGKSISQPAKRLASTITLYWYGVRELLVSKYYFHAIQAFGGRSYNTVSLNRLQSKSSKQNLTRAST